jgi:hypothetical protein
MAVKFIHLRDVLWAPESIREIKTGTASRLRGRIKMHTLVVRSEIHISDLCIMDETKFEKVGLSLKSETTE